MFAFSPEVKSCFTVLDDDGSNEVTPFEFKQLETKRIASSSIILRRWKNRIYNFETHFLSFWECFNSIFYLQTPVWLELHVTRCMVHAQGMPSLWLSRACQTGVQGLPHVFEQTCATPS